MGDRYPVLVRDDAALMVTELAANAVLHAASDFAVSFDERLDLVEIGVTDRSARLPRQQAPSAIGGRGLGIVDTLAVQWGCREADDGNEGKTVFFRLRVLPARRGGGLEGSRARNRGRRLEMQL